MESQHTNHHFSGAESVTDFLVSETNGIDIAQWQSEIDSFIAETSDELNDIVRQLENINSSGSPLPPRIPRTTGEPMPDPIDTKTDSSKTNQKTRSTQQTQDPDQRLASLREKLANRLEKKINRNPD
jgi:hypothetical protein